MTQINPEIIIQYLNSLLFLDKIALQNLIETRVQCNEKLANHETVQVLEGNGDNIGTFSVGLLGILNGLCGIDEDGWGYIVVKMDKDNNINKFCHKKDIDK